MTLILKCGGVVYRVNVAGHDFILCHVIYICGVLRARPCNYRAVCSVMRHVYRSRRNLELGNGRTKCGTPFSKVRE